MEENTVVVEKAKDRKGSFIASIIISSFALIALLFAVFCFSGVIDIISNPPSEDPAADAIGTALGLLILLPLMWLSCAIDALLSIISLITSIRCMKYYDKRKGMVMLIINIVFIVLAIFMVVFSNVYNYSGE